jgi:hypothetical protein
MSGQGYAQVGLAAGDEQELHEGQQPVVVLEEVADAVPVAVAMASDSITVKVKSPDDKTHELVLSAGSRTEVLRGKLTQLTGLPAERQRLICLGKLLSDDKTLGEQGVKDGTFIHLVPKPAGACGSSGSSSSSSGSSGSSGSGPGGASGPIEMPAHIAEILARGAASGAGDSVVPVGLDAGAGHYSFEDEYELNIWRYRVRMLALIMMLYYVMALMAGLNNWMEPEGAPEGGSGSGEDSYARGGQFVQVKPDNWLSLVDTVENLLGIAAATVGLKTAVRNCTRLSQRFEREINVLCVVHFINLALWISALYRGEIVQIPMRPRHHNHSDANSGVVQMSEAERQDNIRSLVGALLIVHPLLWVSIVSIAQRYHKCLVYRDAVLNPPAAAPAPTAAPAPPAAPGQPDAPLGHVV